jgi:hypothetical protein
VKTIDESQALVCDEGVQSSTPERRVVGRPFPKGVSGNPGGRPKVVAEVMRALEEAAPGAAARLVELTSHPDPKVRHLAIVALLDRVIGKPKETINLNQNGNGFLVAIMRDYMQKVEGG